MTKDAKQLAEAHTDPEWRWRYRRICDLLDMLNDCIITRDYSIPDEMNTAIALSPAGGVLFDRLTRQEKVPPKEARLMCALSLGHDELFIDVNSFKIDQFRHAIEHQMLGGHLRFPFVFGRQLYDAYAELFEEPKDSLPVEETQRLLDKVPMGVFQYGSFVIGPYGILESPDGRGIRGSRQVPAYHCSQVVCQRVHHVHLTTSQDAPINDHRSKISRILEERGEASEWWGLAFEFDGYIDGYYSDLASPIAGLIGDALDDGEMKSLVADLLDSTQGSVRGLIEPVARVGSAADFVTPLGRNQMLQIALLATEDQISRSLRSLVRTGKIKVALGDVRRPVINANRRSGAFRLSAELGSVGVRLVSDDAGIPALRLRRMLQALYLRDNSEDMAELEWQLRGHEAEDIDERLEDFYLASSPRQALKQLVLARKANLIAAGDAVRIDDLDTLSDDDAVDSLLWALGFDVHSQDDAHAYFWDLHDRITSLSRSSRIPGTSEEETFRGIATTYFTELEGLLAGALAFTTWALLHDHVNAHTPFSYDNEQDRLWGLTRLQVAHEQSNNEHEVFDFTSEKLELHMLFRGFEVLSSELGRVAEHAESYARAAVDYPEWEGRTSLKSFPFMSQAPFLNLKADSQIEIRTRLKGVATGLVSGYEITEARNWNSHFRRNSRESPSMTKAIEAIGTAVREIESLGAAPIICRPLEITADPWGRARHRFAGPRNATHLFARPSNFDWAGLPSLTEPQYIIQSAKFAEPNEVLRFGRRFDSPFARMWSDYPKRRKSGAEAPTAGSGADEGTGEGALTVEGPRSRSIERDT